MKNKSPEEIKIITDLLGVAEQTLLYLTQKGLGDCLFANQVKETINQTNKYLK